VRHYLLSELAKDRKEHEYGEHLVLQTLLSKWGLEKYEADKERLLVC
jgi:hypothetical protein